MFVHIHIHICLVTIHTFTGVKQMSMRYLFFYYAYINRHIGLMTEYKIKNLSMKNFHKMFFSISGLIWTRMTTQDLETFKPLSTLTGFMKPFHHTKHALKKNKKMSKYNGKFGLTWTSINSFQTIVVFSWRILRY